MKIKAMIIEIGKSSDDLYGAVLYNTHKVEEQLASIVYRRGVNLSPGETEARSIIRDLTAHIPQSAKTKNIVFHASFNPTPADNLTETDITIIAERYMAEMGYKDQPYVLFKHNDIEREHYHLVSVRVDSNGKKIKDNNEKYRTLQFRRKIEQEFGLIAAEKQKRLDLLEHGHKKVDAKKGDIKAQMATLIKQASEYHLQSFAEYRSVLRRHNIEVSEVKGETPQGKPYRGMVYTALGDDGRAISKAIPSSQFSRQIRVDCKELDKRIKKEKGYFAQSRFSEKPLLSLRSKIDQALHPDLDTFVDRLRKRGVDGVLYRSEGDGRVYGITYIDNASRIVVKGSALGKEYSAGALEKLLEGSRERWEQIGATRQELLSIIDQYEFGNYHAFEHLMQQNGYSLSFDYGLVYTDRQGREYRATDLGDEFRVESIRERYTDSDSQRSEGEGHFHGSDLIDFLESIGNEEYTPVGFDEKERRKRQWKINKMRK